MLTREQVLQKLDSIAQEVVELKEIFEQLWQEPSSTDPTHAFLAKCSGWQDTRSADEIIADIYSARTVSERAATLFTTAEAV